MGKAVINTTLINFAAFQIGWFACVLGAAYHMPWVGPVVVALAIALHLQRARAPMREVMLILAAGLVGAIWDSLLVAYAGMRYTSGTLIANTAPYWIVAMWMLFATTLNVSLRWLKQRWMLAALFGALGGPLAYYAGAELGALTFTDLGLAITALAIGWALLVPLLMALSNRFDGALPGPNVQPNGTLETNHV
jgi:hypothetical protein